MRIKVTRGAETFSPVQYNPFVIGPFEIEVDVPDNVDPVLVAKQLRERLDAISEAEVEAQSRKHLERILKVDRMATEMSMGRTR